MSAEDWRELREWSQDSGGSIEAVAALHGEHAAAAWALHGQPFGFTWADVDLLSNVVMRERYESPADHAFADRVYALADRIAALLPPRDP